MKKGRKQSKKDLAKRIFIGFLAFLMIFGALVSSISVFAEEIEPKVIVEQKAEEKTQENLINQIKMLFEKLKELEKDNLELKEENARLLKIKEQGKATKIPVLMYHHLYDGDLEQSQFKGNSAVISVDMFKEQMKFLKDNNFHTATLKELEMFINKKIDLPEKTVVITFDDGYYSNIEYAYPIMKEYGFKGTIFTIGKNTKDASDDHAVKTKTLRSLSYEDIKNTADVFDIESHTYQLHKHIDGIPALTVLSREEITEDLKTVKEQLSTEYLAYPFGGYNQQVIEVLQEVGYKLAFTVKEGYATVDSLKYEVPRFTISPWVTIERFSNIVNKK